MDPWVTPSVERMSYERLPYADAETLTAMGTDARGARESLRLPGQRSADGAGPVALMPASPATFASSVAVPDSLARLAGDLELHLD